VSPDVIVYVCTNCVDSARRLPRQWTEQEAHVLVREIPCSGKVDAQYLFHAMEGGARGVCVVACPKGDCQLAQGNLRAEVRINTLKRLLTEIGFEAGRAELIHVSSDDAAQPIEPAVRAAVQRIAAHGESPLRAMK
jgi:coenzyme F420-reducing hydrogenase delta subunit